MKYVEQAEILENTAIIPAVWKMVFRAPKMAAQAKPGQFVNVHYDGGTTFLRRPFGIVDADAASGAVTIIYRIVNASVPVTALMPKAPSVTVPSRRRRARFLSSVAVSAWHRSFSWPRHCRKNRSSS